MAPSIRTCVGCRQRGPADEMIRLALTAGRITFAASRRADSFTGRGASIHRRADCVAGALRPGVLSRAFKQPVDMSSDGADLLRQLTAVLRNQGAS
jgi:predicted RNA-binding protein YlxR (DUF448 family)